ncbi:MAG: hypothetical protein LBG15_15670 [Dysgonamonadaceae bacterium]|jgi:hypothetical protein|nr:hypothetical protein [Dysgonamonadaceae bacterium]
MKKIILLTVILFISCGIQAQEVTRGQLIDLHYKARKAEKANNPQEALEIYKTILSVDTNLPAPYLKMADIYAADESNAESVLIAISLYNKYLLLQPDDENAPVLRKKVAYLQKLAGKEENVNLTDLLYINQEQAQNVIAAKARRGLKASTKEELVQQIEDANTLYDNTQTAINSGNVQGGIQQLEQLLEQTDPTSPLYTQANMQLAEMYGKQGDVQKMQEILAAVEENMEINKDISQYLNTKIKDATPFEDDICGIWVSDLSFDIDKDAIPYLVMEIAKDGNRDYNSKILPYCTYAKKMKMYQGNPFNYHPVSAEGANSSYIAHSYSNTTIPQNEIISFSFGDQKFRAGISTGTVEFVAGVTDEITESVAKSAAYQLDDPLENAAVQLGIYAVGTIIKSVTYLLSLDTKKTVHIATNMERIFSGVAQLNMVTTNIVEKSNHYEKESTDSIQIKMYKLYPEYNIMFADKDNELFGYKQFSESETKKSEEYGLLSALKERGYFNRRSYKNLEQKIVDYCWAKSDENPNMKTMAAICMESFEHAKKGLFELNYEDANGSFAGWINMKGQKNGNGALISHSGYKYVGIFENDRLKSGSYTVFDPETKNVKAEYTGEFKNDKFDGNGLMTTFDSTGQKLSFLDGKWKAGEFKEGQGSYDGGIFTGKWKMLKKERKIVPDGKGVWVKPDSETTGTWKNGVYVEEKQKKLKNKE